MKTLKFVVSIAVLASLTWFGRVSPLPDLAGDALAALPPGGRILYAASCAQTDVQAAVDAADDGDLVVVPPGHCTWTTLQAHTPSLLIEKKGVTLFAAEGSVVIADETGPNWHEEPIIVIDASGFRITGFTFTGMKRRSSTEKAIQMSGDCRGWRIDHCTFDVSASEIGEQGSGVTLTGKGVVDHCTFLNTYTSVVFMGDGDASWERPPALGSAGAIYAEDNVMNNTAIVGDGATDGYNGARYVFRHNTVLNARAGHHGFDSGGYRSPHSFEIYANTFHWTVPNSWYTWRSRGGTGVVFDNVITGDVSGGLSFGVVNYRTCCCNWCTNVDPAAPGYPCTPFTACAAPLHSNCGQWGRCDGQNPLDGNLDATGYPCKDQTGRTTDSDGDGIQDAAPVYVWNNTLNGADAQLTVSDPWGCDTPSMADHIQEGRDFFNGIPRPDYMPYVYPHPLTQDVLLTAAPLDRAARLDWDVVTAFAFPISTTWRIEYVTGSAAPIVAASGLVSTTHAYTLTGLTNGVSYSVTLNGVVNLATLGETRLYTATAAVTPGASGLVLRGRGADRAAHLDWSLSGALPATSTWTIAYQSPGTVYLPVTGLTNTLRAYTLTGLTNYAWYTVTLNAVLDATPILTGTVHVMPTDINVYLPLVLRSR
ncbi:MAG: hypothetical protein JXA21_21020 [Anaerolineae bacterium]|nr:hypothetical protein [Anaerolineae bacterium]